MPYARIECVQEAISEPDDNVFHSLRQLCICVMQCPIPCTSMYIRSHTLNVLILVSAFTLCLTSILSMYANNFMYKLRIPQLGPSGNYRETFMILPRESSEVKFSDFQP